MLLRLTFPPEPTADTGCDGEKPGRSGAHDSENEGAGRSKKTGDERCERSEGRRRIAGDGPGRGHIEDQGFRRRFWPKGAKELAKLRPEENGRDQEMRRKEKD